MGPEARQVRRVLIMHGMYKGKTGTELAFIPDKLGRVSVEVDVPLNSQRRIRFHRADLIEVGREVERNEIRRGGCASRVGSGANTMSDVHCDKCGADREVDRTGPWCGDPACCAPIYWLPCGCPGADWCYGDDCNHAATE